MPCSQNDIISIHTHSPSPISSFLVELEAHALTGLQRSKLRRPGEPAARANGLVRLRGVLIVNLNRSLATTPSSGVSEQLRLTALLKRHEVADGALDGGCRDKEAVVLHQSA